MALSARQKADVLIRKILSPPDPLKPGKTIVEEPLVDLASGQLLRPIPERLQPIKRSGGWWCAVDTDPALDPDASWEDYELFEQKIYVNHPLVSSSGSVQRLHANSCMNQQQQQQQHPARLGNMDSDMQYAACMHHAGVSQRSAEAGQAEVPQVQQQARQGTADPRLAPWQPPCAHT
jgi:hypothetical protein